MRIVETYDVTFSGDWILSANRSEYEGFWVEDDNGERQQVYIPTIDNLHKKFIWMSENDCLRHLKTLEPAYTTNEDEIQAIWNYNAQIEENAYALNQVTYSYDMRTGQKVAHIAKMKPIPKKVYSCTWTFWSKQHAVMFKLAQGGSL